MSSSLTAATVLVSALAIACQPAGQSPADTTATTSSSTVQSVTGAIVIDTSAATPGKTTKPVSSTGKSGTQIKSSADDPTIRGRDSVIRFPLKKLPPAR